MTKLRWISAAVLLGAAWASPALAQGPGGIIPSPDNPPTRQGTRGANFLHLGIGARGNAMAGAVGSSVEGPTAWFWNPAGAVASEAFSVSFGRQNLYGDLDLAQNYGAVSMPLLGGVVGLSLNTLNSGDIERTTEANPTGDRRAGRFYDWNSTAAGVGYARRMTDRLSLGAQLKFVNEGITDASTSWIAADLGTQFQTGIYGLVIAGALQQVGGQARASGAAIAQQVNNANVNQQSTRVNLDTRQTDLPTAFRFSLGSDMLGTANSLFGARGGDHRLFAEATLNDAVDLATQLGFGAEYSFRNMAFLRAGKRFYNDERAADADFKGAYGLSGGLGLRFPLAGRALKFDYSYTSLGDLRDIQVFSFEFGR